MVKPDRTSQWGRSNDPRYGVADLVRCAVASGGPRSYTQDRYRLLRSKLGVKTDLLVRGGGGEVPELSDRPRTDGSGRVGFVGAPLIAVAAVDALRALHDPFGGLLEAPDDVIALYQTHAQAISAQSGALRAALEQLAVDAVVSSQPELAHTTVSLADLRASGWPDPPPDLDEMY